MAKSVKKKSNLKKVSKYASKSSSSSESSAEQELAVVTKPSNNPFSGWSASDHYQFCQVATVTYMRDWFDKIVRSKAYEGYYNSCLKKVTESSQEERAALYESLLKPGAAKSSRKADPLKPKRPRTAYIYWSTTEFATAS